MEIKILTGLVTDRTGLVSDTYKDTDRIVTDTNKGTDRLVIDTNKVTDKISNWYKLRYCEDSNSYK